MPSIIDKLRELSYQLGEKYRLAGLPILTGIELTFSLLGHLAASQGKTNLLYRKQMLTEVTLLHLTAEQIKQAEQAYLRGQQVKTEFFEASLRYFQAEELAKEMLLQSCWRMIWADRHLAVREYQLVHLWGYWLGWDRPAIERLGVPYRPIYISHEHQQALALLEVTTDSSPEMIKQMYKRQLSRYHPDKIIGAGDNLEAINNATEQTIKIQEAYALIRMLHNF